MRSVVKAQHEEIVQVQTSQTYFPITWRWETMQGTLSSKTKGGQCRKHEQLEQLWVSFKAFAQRIVFSLAPVLIPLRPPRI